MVWKSETRIEKERIESKIDNSIFKKKSNSKTFSGWLIGKIKQARDRENTELVILLNEIYKKQMEFQKSERFTPAQWKGKAKVNYIETPEKVICVRYQKIEPYEQPKEIKVEILREEINRVIWAISALNSGIWLETSTIAEKVYNMPWKVIFSDRPKHIKLTEIFNYLEYKGKIDYSRSGKVFLK